MDPYKILGIEPTASREEIDAAYREKVKKHHPDAGGDAWVFQQVHEAYLSLCSQQWQGPAAGKQPQPGEVAAAPWQPSWDGEPDDDSARPAPRFFLILAGALLGALVGGVAAWAIGVEWSWGSLAGAIGGGVVGMLTRSR
jgi:hypothetical protein